MVSECLPSDHIGSFVDVGHTVHEALDTGELLAHERLGVLPVVQILGHLFHKYIFIIISTKRDTLGVLGFWGFGVLVF